jgi:hypothetical protein
MPGTRSQALSFLLPEFSCSASATSAGRIAGIIALAVGAGSTVPLSSPQCARRYTLLIQVPHLEGYGTMAPVKHGPLWCVHSAIAIKDALQSTLGCQPS